MITVIFLITSTSIKIEASSFGRGKSCVENSDCKRGLACDIRKHPATFTCLGIYIFHSYIDCSN